jgi:hypothetical protein
MSKFFCFDCVDKNCLPNLLRIHRTAIQQGIYRRSFKVAFIVGTLLNLINQPQAMFGFLFLDFPVVERLNIIKMLLTYAVPFLVASYVALTARNPKQIE